MPASRTMAGLALGTLALMLACPPARAQLGSVNNPPPQHLFNLGQPPRLDDGLGTMAERRARLAQLKRAQHRRAYHSR
jgi:hypothetical protein